MAAPCGPDCIVHAANADAIDLGVAAMEQAAALDCRCAACLTAAFAIMVVAMRRQMGDEAMLDMLVPLVETLREQARLN